MKTKNFFFLLLSVLLVSACSKNYNDTIVLEDGEILYNLSMKVEDGKKFSVKSTRSLKMDMDYFGNQNTLAFDIDYSGILEKNSSSFILKLESAEIKIVNSPVENLSSPGGYESVEVDSSEEEKNINLLLQKAVDKLGAISFKVNENKQVVFDSDVNFGTLMPDEEAFPEFLDLLTAESLRNFLEPLFLWVPDTLPVIGESWTIMSNQAAPAQGELFQKYTLQKVSGKKYLVSLVSEGVSKYSVDSFNYTGSVNGTGKLKISRKDSFSGTYEIEDNYRLKVAVPVNLFDYEESDLESLCKIREVKKMIVKEVEDVK